MVFPLVLSPFLQVKSSFNQVNQLKFLTENLTWDKHIHVQKNISPDIIALKS